MIKLAVVVAGLCTLAAPAVASATPVTISLLHARSYCINRNDGGKSDGTTVDLYACSGGNDTWDEIQNPEMLSAPLCGGVGGNTCMEFEVPGTKTCFGLSPTTGEGQLQSCYEATADWNQGLGHQLHNEFWSGSGWLYTPGTYNRSKLYEGAPSTDWYSWYGF